MPEKSLLIPPTPYRKPPSAKFVAAVLSEADFNSYHKYPSYTRLGFKVTTVETHVEVEVFGPSQLVASIERSLLEEYVETLRAVGIDAVLVEDTVSDGSVVGRKVSVSRWIPKEATEDAG